MLVLAALAAAGGNAWAVANSERDLEQYLKPAVPLVLFAACFALTPVDGAARLWFALALVLCAAGDVAMFHDRFLPGLGLFAVAHVGFALGFATRDPSVWWAAVGLVAATVLIYEVGRPVLMGVTLEAPRLRWPVAGYIGLLGLLVAMAVATRTMLGVLGALSFAASDALIGHRRFLEELPWHRLATMASYHLALVLLVVSLTQNPWS